MNEPELQNTLPDSVALLAPDMTLFGRAQKAASSARGIVVDSPAMYAIAAAELQSLKSLLDAVEQSRVTLKKPILEAGRGIDGFFKKPIEWIGTAMTETKQAMLTYQREQDRIAREKQAEADRLTALERQKLQAQAALAAKDNQPEAAEALRAMADVISAPVVASAAPQAAGIATVKRWTASVDDQSALLAYIIANPQFGDWIEIKTSKLVEYARATSGRAKVPGVTFLQSEGLSVRGSA